MIQDLMDINTPLVKQLIVSQFPEWKNLSIRPVAETGWDNRTFHLGNEMLIRLPSAVAYAPQVEKEHHYLPKLAPLLPLKIPHPIAMGKPGEGYPWKWSVYQWLEGAPASPHSNRQDLAKHLATFLTTLQNIDVTGGPLPGPENFYRGGSLSHYDQELREALSLLTGHIPTDQALEIWETGLQSTWSKPPVWIHGDISPNNLLVDQGKLSAVIDFGQLAIGDPACDLMITWTFFTGNSRDAFRSSLPLDTETWNRARAWTLWKAAIVSSGLTSALPSEQALAPHTLQAVLADDTL